MADPKLPPLEWVRCVAGRTLPSNDQPWGDLARWALAVREAARPFVAWEREILPTANDADPAYLETGEILIGDLRRLARLIGGDDES